MVRSIKTAYDTLYLGHNVMFVSTMRRDYKRPNCVKHDEKKTDVHWKAGFRNVIMRKRRD